MDAQPKDNASNEKLVVMLPFSGFDADMWIYSIGDQLAFEGFNLASQDIDDEPLEEDEYINLVEDFWIPGKGLKYLASVYAKGFLAKLQDIAGIAGACSFESVHLTDDAFAGADRIFVRLDKKLVSGLFEISAATGHSDLQDIWADLTVSRGTYYSLYDPDFCALMATPLRKWDHNQLYALVCATADRDHERDVHDEMMQGGAFLEAFWRAVDRKKFERAIRRAKQRK
jgi:hypothetical protein